MDFAFHSKSFFQVVKQKKSRSLLNFFYVKVQFNRFSLCKKEEKQAALIRNLKYKQTRNFFEYETLLVLKIGIDIELILKFAWYTKRSVAQYFSQSLSKCPRKSSLASKSSKKARMVPKWGKIRWLLRFFFVRTKKFMQEIVWGHFS